MAAPFSSKLCPSPPTRCRKGKQAHMSSSNSRNETASTVSNGLLCTKIDFSPVISSDPNRSPVEIRGEKMEVFASLMRTLILGKVSDLPKGTQMGVQTSERVPALPGGSERGPMQSSKFTARKGTLRNRGCNTFKTLLLQSSHTRSFSAPSVGDWSPAVHKSTSEGKVQTAPPRSVCRCRSRRSCVPAGQRALLPVAPTWSLSTLGGGVAQLRSRWWEV